MRLEALPLLVFAACLAACVATSEPSPEPSSAEEERLVLGPPLHGLVEMNEFVVPVGYVVLVDGDLDLRVRGGVRIAGSLIVLDATGAEHLDAPRVTIASPLVIDVPGRVLGGRGADGTTADGGRGSSILLVAPQVYIDGEVRGGDGALGGYGSKGGDGGDALVEGFYNVRNRRAHTFGLVSGRGGNGGFPGGAGGHSGAAIAEVPDEVRANFDSLRPLIHAELQRLSSR